MNEYSYKELYQKATSSGAVQKDVDALGEWFERYGADFWNGEEYDADGLTLIPVFTNDNAEPENHEITGYLLKQ